ncbi:MAG: endonuclease V [Candidatus Omnitrophota bacterium]|nr:MAG: endonuclease V [Candidatus Omnitrophota bacterium]
MKFKNIHSWDLGPKEAIRLQNSLKQKIKLKKYSIIPKLIAAADVAFKDDKAYGVVIVLNYPSFEIIEQVFKTAEISYPYIPGLLTFREGPVLEKCFKALKTEPEIILFDGQGIAHPRNMGLATHFGILLDKPAIGCAKTRLFGNYTEPKQRQGAFSYLLDKQGRKIGAVLRTRSNVKPVYISPGHNIDLAASIRIILMCTKKYRLPQPLRLAHQLTGKMKPGK